MEIHLGKPRSKNPEHVFNAMLSHGGLMMRGVKVYKKTGKYLFVYPSYEHNGRQIPFFKWNKETEQLVVDTYEQYGSKPLPDFYPRPDHYNLSIFSEVVMEKAPF